MSLKLIINNKEADLYADTSIEIETRSGFFAKEGLSGSFSVNFKIPYRYSARNKIIFKFIGAIGTASAPVELPFSFEVNGTEIARGTLVATSAAEEVECSFLLENGQFNDQIAKKSLKDYFFGLLAPDINKTNYNESDQIAWANYYNPAVHANTYLAHDAEGDTLIQQNVQVNVYVDGVLQTGLDDYQIVNQVWNFANSPQFFVKNLLQEIFRINGFFLKTSFLEQTEFQNLALFSAYEANEFAVIITNFFTPPATIRQISGIQLASNALPEEKIKDFLIYFADFFNASYFFEKNEISIILNEEIILSEDVELLPESFRVISVRQNEENGYKISFSVPEEDLFFEKHKILSEIKYIEQTIYNLDDYLYFGPASISSLGIPIEARDYYLDPVSKILYSAGEAIYAPQGIDAKLAKLQIETLATGLQPIIEGGQSWQLEIKASAMGAFTPSEARRPTVANEYTKKTFGGLRFGFVNNAVGGCSFSGKNGYLSLADWQKQVPGAQSTFWNRCWKNSMNFVLTRKEIEAEISAVEGFLFAKTFTGAKKYIDHEGNKYLFSSLTTSYNKNGIGKITLKGWTVL